jgi:hypothetical protein
MDRRGLLRVPQRVRFATLLPPADRTAARFAHTPAAGIIQRTMSENLPPLQFGEEYGNALLLAMVVHHCATATPGELDGAITANTAAMIDCAESGYIDITGQADGHIFAVVLPEGWALMERLRAEQEKYQVVQQTWIDRVIRERPRALPKERLTDPAKQHLQPSGARQTRNRPLPPLPGTITLARGKRFDLCRELKFESQKGNSRLNELDNRPFGD